MKHLFNFSLKLWNPYKGTVLKTYTGHGHEVLDTQSSGDSRLVILLPFKADLKIIFTAFQ